MALLQRNSPVAGRHAVRQRDETLLRRRRSRGRTPATSPSATRRSRPQRLSRCALGSSGSGTGARSRATPRATSYPEPLERMARAVGDRAADVVQPARRFDVVGVEVSPRPPPSPAPCRRPAPRAPQRFWQRRASTNARAAGRREPAAQDRVLEKRRRVLEHAPEGFVLHRSTAPRADRASRSGRAPRESRTSAVAVCAREQVGHLLQAPPHGVRRRSARTTGCARVAPAPRPVSSSVSRSAVARVPSDAVALALGNAHVPVARVAQRQVFDPSAGAAIEDESGRVDFRHRHSFRSARIRDPRDAGHSAGSSADSGRSLRGENPGVSQGH